MAKWIGCADIDFGNPTPRLAMRTVHRYIRTLNVKVEDVMGIAAVFESQNQVVRITFHKEATCSAFLAEHQGIRKEKLEERDIAIVIKDSNVQEKFVRISGLPYQMNLGIVKTRFREFGNVLDLRWESYHVVDDEFLYPVLSTWLICRMTLEKHIPSYITLGSYKAVVRYSGQIPTCRICDQHEHIGRNCPTLAKNRRVIATKTPPVPKTARVEKSNNVQEVILENKDDGNRDAVGSENELIAPEPQVVEPRNEVPIEEPPKEIPETQVIPETQPRELPMAEENLPPPVTVSVDSSNINLINTEDKMDTSDTESVMSSSSQSLVHSKIPSRIAHTPSATFLAAKAAKEKNPGPSFPYEKPPRKTPKTQ